MKSFGAIDGRARRRGAKLGLLIALLAVVPGLVAGTAFITASTSGTNVGTTTNAAPLACGFAKDSTDGEVTITGSSITSTIAGGAQTFTMNTVETGGATTADSAAPSGYQYEVDEFVFGCDNLPAGTTYVDLVICGADVPAASAVVTAGASPTGTCAQAATESVVNADWVAMDYSTALPDIAASPVTVPGASCGATQGTYPTGSVATSGPGVYSPELYGQTGSSAKNDLYFADNPATADKTVPTSTTMMGYTGTAGTAAVGADAGCSPGSGATVSQTSSSATNKPTVTLSTVTPTATAGAEALLLGFTIACTTAPCGGTAGTVTTAGSAYTFSPVGWIGFALEDEQVANGLESCTSSSCAVGSTGAAFSSATAFTIGWAAVA